MTDPLHGLRRQYHFMPDDDGKKAWDVHRLIELAEQLPTDEIPIESIAEIDTVHWFDADFHRPTVRAVIEHLELIRDADPPADHRNCHPSQLDYTPR